MPSLFIDTLLKYLFKILKITMHVKQIKLKIRSKGKNMSGFS